MTDHQFLIHQNLYIIIIIIIITSKYYCTAVIGIGLNSRKRVAIDSIFSASASPAIFLKHVKIEEKLLWRAYRNLPTLFRTVPSPTPYGLIRLGVRNPHPKTSISIISGIGKATDFRFGRYIHRVHPSKSPLKSLEKRERGRIQGLPNFFGYPLAVISGTAW